MVQPAQPGPVRRLTFEYDGDEIWLISEQHVRMIVPPSQPLENADALAGFNVVLRDEQNRPVYRFARTSPIRHDAEVFSEPGTDESIQRVPVDHPKGAFVLLVPDVPGAKSLELVGHPPRADAFREQPQRLARFELKPFEGSDVWVRGTATSLE
ncbi:MAG: hypothetical protein JWM87_2394 [Candidatus Eremiobacteraeota bacterium]|nr:hypothetical protein [Candidatus Eremiobacteraeota bacterium]